MKTRLKIIGLSVALLAVVLVIAPASAEYKSAVRDRHDRHDRHVDDADRDRAKDRHSRNDRKHGSHVKHYSLSFSSHRRVPHRVIYTRRVYVAGYYEKRWLEPVYETRCDSCGRSYQVLIREGCYERIWVPGHYETRTEYRNYAHDRHSYGHHGRYRNRHGSSCSVYLRF